jgi:hypothetical protein
LATTTDEATRVDATPSPSVYDGFISYSHAADDLLAPRLQAGLQRFARPWWKRRALRVFRDESSLSANPHLWSSITEALDGSEWFVLLLSEEAAQSEWVNREVAYWVEHKDPARILPVVTNGEFGWEDGDVSQGDISESSTAAPPALSGVFEEEPRWVDLRWARSDEHLDLNNARFRDAVADVASAIRGVPKDELESEEVRQHRRTIRTAWAAGVIVLLLGIAATLGAIVAVGQSKAAQSQRDEAELQAEIAQNERDTSQRERDRADEQARIARENEQKALDAQSEAEVERDRADEEAERANEEAARARDVTELLLDFILQQTQSGIEAPDPNFSEAADFLPVPLVEAESPPANTRFDFVHDICENTSGGRGNSPDCFRDALFVDPAQERGTPFWLADRPFHIRHGFANPAENAPLVVDGPGFAGYDLRVYVTRRDGPELSNGAYELDRTLVFHSDYMVRETIDNCGLDAEPQPCDVFVHDFPDGLPAGKYEFRVEWYAPCTAWVDDADLCLGQDESLNLFYSQADVRFFSEDYPAVNLEDDLGNCSCTEFSPGWPFDPWEWTRRIP